MGRISPVNVMREQSAVERTPLGRGAGASRMGEVNSLSVQGKGGDFVSMLRGGLLWVRKAERRMGSTCVGGTSKGQEIPPVVIAAPAAEDVSWQHFSGVSNASSGV